MHVLTFRVSSLVCIAALCGILAAPLTAHAQAENVQIKQGLENITALTRQDKVGYATFFDGNKFVQCRPMADRTLRCEAAGTVMQSSLRNVLTGERLNRLAALGWTLDPSFGNYVQVFPADTTLDRIAARIAETLSEAYAANVADLDVTTRWMTDVPCPPRSGPSQNLAGSVNDAPSMRFVVVHGCAYVAPPDSAQKMTSADDLIAMYGKTVAAEIQRLRINAASHVFAIFDAGIGYVQCGPAANAIYCEAQSEESWPAIAAVLTPERIAWLKSVGYEDPGRGPNYWKSYPLDAFSDAAVAGEVLTVLYRAYNYTGASKLEITTE